MAKVIAQRRSETAGGRGPFARNFVTLLPGGRPSRFRRLPLRRYFEPLVFDQGGLKHCYSFGPRAGTSGGEPPIKLGPSGIQRDATGVGEAGGVHRVPCRPVIPS
jgi:hypothetical protein